MQTRSIAGVNVSAIGLGAMPMSVHGRPDEAQSLRTIHAALDCGIRLIDTADAYCLGAADTGHNERLVAKGLRTYGGDTADVLVATKGGHYRPADGSWQLAGRPEALRAACEASLVALDIDCIGLYQYHRPDPAVPYAESIGALKELRDEGKIRLVGISNASTAQITQAMGIVGLASVQNEFSPAFRSSEAEVRFCADRGVAFLAWSPLGGMGNAADLGGRHAEFRAVAAEHGVSAQRVALAWMLAKAPVVVPIPGSRRPETIADSAAAATLQLSEEQRRRLDAA